MYKYNSTKTCFEGMFKDYGQVFYVSKKVHRYNNLKSIVDVVLKPTPGYMVNYIYIYLSFYGGYIPCRL